MEIIAIIIIAVFIIVEEEGEEEETVREENSDYSCSDDCCCVRVSVSQHLKWYSYLRRWTRGQGIVRIVDVVSLLHVAGTFFDIFIFLEVLLRLLW